MYEKVTQKEVNTQQKMLKESHATRNMQRKSRNKKCAKAVTQQEMRKDNHATRNAQTQSCNKICVNNKDSHATGDAHRLTLTPSQSVVSARGRDERL